MGKIYGEAVNFSDDGLIPASCTLHPRLYTLFANRQDCAKDGETGIINFIRLL
jgi:hypothetical protein